MECINMALPARTPAKPKAAYQRTICIDFDGVLHAYESEWVDAVTILDGPVDGAIDWLRRLILSVDFRPVIYSSRSSYPGAIKSMQEWLMLHGMHESEVCEIEFPTTKPAAFLTVDDRAVQFIGLFPTLEEMLLFKPWNKQ